VTTGQGVADRGVLTTAGREMCVVEVTLDRGLLFGESVIAVLVRGLDLDLDLGLGLLMTATSVTASTTSTRNTGITRSIAAEVEATILGAAIKSEGRQWKHTGKGMRIDWLNGDSDISLS